MVPLLLISCGKRHSDETPKGKLTNSSIAAIESLKKLSLKTKIGTTFAAYSSALPDAVYPATEYLKSRDGAENTVINDLLRTAVRDYLMAHDAWSRKINNTYRDDDPKYEYGDSLPVTISILFKGRYTDDKDWLEPDRAISMIWAHASETLDKLETMKK